MRKKPRIFMMSTDGSKTSKIAFTVCVDELMDKKDIVHVVSITDCSKEFLPNEFQPKYILDDYKTELIGRLPHDRFDIHLDEKHQDSDVKEQLAKIAHKLEASYLVVGNFGRKGDLENSYRIGKTANTIVEMSRVPLIVIKRHYQRKKNASGGFNFLIAFDGSDKSYNLIEKAKDLARNNNDKVFGVNVCEDGQCDKVELEQTFRDKCAEKKCPLAGVEFIDNTEELIVETLNKYANENEKNMYDFLLIGSTGLNSQKSQTYFMGKMATHLLNKTCLNILIIP